MKLKCRGCKKEFKYSEKDIITNHLGVPCEMVKCPRCSAVNVLDIDFPSGISKKVVGVRPKGLILSGKAKI